MSSRILHPELPGKFHDDSFQRHPLHGKTEPEPFYGSDGRHSFTLFLGIPGIIATEVVPD